MTISGKRETSKEEKKGKTTYSETCSNEVFRVVDLPVEVDTDRATATLKDGILQLTMPKAAKARTVQIRPQAAIVCGTRWASASSLTHRSTVNSDMQTSIFIAKLLGPIFVLVGIAILSKPEAFRVLYSTFDRQLFLL